MKTKRQIEHKTIVHNSEKLMFGIGAILLLIHGIIELLPTLQLLLPANSMAPSFIFKEISDNWQMTIGVSIVSGLIRIIAAVGILKNLKWGWNLGVIISIITFTMLTFYLPMGIMDAIFSGSVLVFLMIGKNKGEKIIQ